MLPSPAAFLFLALAAPSVTAARVSTIKPADIFSNNMVLQQGQPVAVWGTAEAGTTVTVEVAGRSRTCETDADGAWRAELPSLPATSEPLSMRLSSPGATTVTLANVLVGEVWLCAGQSNMFWPLGASGIYPGIKGSEQDLAGADQPMLRLNCDPEHELNGGGWQVCSPESARGFSATAFYFGRRLSARLGVPVGLVNRSRGGSPIQHWTPRDAALAVPLTRKYADLFNAHRQEIDRYNGEFVDYLAALQTAHSGGGTTRPTEPKRLPDELMSARHFYQPGILFERLIRPVVPLAMRGVVWYQGEANSEFLDVAQAHALMLAALIVGWRDEWNLPDLPFLFVQLPCWTPGKFWPWVRQGQLDAARAVPATAMVVTVDAGEPDELHPNNKRVVGERIADAALGRVYGLAGAGCGPLAKGARPTPGGVVVEFEQTSPPLTAKGGELRDFELAPANGRFVPAKARIADSGVIVSAAGVRDPAFVRYGWKPAFAPSLFDAEGLPASPFALSLKGRQATPPIAESPATATEPATRKAYAGTTPQTTATAAGNAPGQSRGDRSDRRRQTRPSADSRQKPGSPSAPAPKAYPTPSAWNPWPRLPSR